MALKRKAAPASRKKKPAQSITRSMVRPGLRPLTRAISGLKVSPVSASGPVTAPATPVLLSKAGGVQAAPPRPRKQGARARAPSVSGHVSGSTAVLASAPKLQSTTGHWRKPVPPVRSDCSSAPSVNPTTVVRKTLLDNAELQAARGTTTSAGVPPPKASSAYDDNRWARMKRRGEEGRAQSRTQQGRMFEPDMTLVTRTTVQLSPALAPPGWTERIDVFRVFPSNRRPKALSLRPMDMNQELSGGTVPIQWADNVLDILGSVSPAAVPGTVNNSMYNFLVNRPDSLSIFPVFDPTHRWVLQSKNGTARSVMATRYIQRAQGLQRHPAEHLVSAFADVECSFSTATDDRCQFLEAIGAHLIDVSRSWPCRYARERNYALRFGGRFFRFKDFDMNPDSSSAQWSFQIFEICETSRKTWLIAQGETNPTGVSVFMGLDWNTRRSDYTDELVLIRYVLSCIPGKKFEVRDLPFDAPSLYLYPF